MFTQRASTKVTVTRKNFHFTGRNLECIQAIIMGGWSSVRTTGAEEQEYEDSTNVIVEVIAMVTRIVDININNSNNCSSGC